jgi:leader peptidase (prepilin peptidase)/N-methyltransferase
MWTVFAFGVTGETLLIMALCSALLVITFIDLDHQIIPDVITLPGMVIGLVAAPFFMTALMMPLPFKLGHAVPYAGPYLVSFLNSLIGLLLGGGPLWFLGWLWERLRKVEAMGGGDVKLMGMVGSFLGWQGAIMTIILGAMAGSILGIALIVLKRHQADKHIPFGPFLALGALISIFSGTDISEWYFGLMRP